MLAATFIMAIISAFVSRRACLRHDRRRKVQDLKTVTSVPGGMV
jgi:hypothetical protein